MSLLLVGIRHPDDVSPVAERLQRRQVKRREPPATDQSDPIHGDAPAMTGFHGNVTRLRRDGKCS